MQLDFLPDDSENIESSRDQIRRDTLQLVERIRPVIEHHGIQEFHEDTLRELGMGVTWRVFNAFDGVRDPKFFQEKPDPQAERKRAWSREHLGEETLQQLLFVVGNQAVLQPYGNWGGGLTRGHDVLCDHLLNKKGSLFHSAATPEVRYRIHNGRFWEMLHDIGIGSGGHSIGPVEYLLEKFDLDPNYWHRGSRLLTAAENSTFEPELRLLSDKAIVNYEKLISRMSLSKDDALMLVRPYVLGVLNWDDDIDEPRFDVQEMYAIPLVRDVLSNSFELREEVYKEVSERIGWRSYDTVRRFVFDVIEAMPDSKTADREFRKFLDVEQWTLDAWARIALYAEHASEYQI